MILQSSKNSKRNRERDVNTLGGNMLRLLREVCNFILFRIHGCVVQRSLNENIIFCFILLPQKFSLLMVGMVSSVGYATHSVLLSTLLWWSTSLLILLREMVAVSLLLLVVVVMVVVSS